MNATINSGLRFLALVVIVIAAAAAGLAVGQLMHGAGDAASGAGSNASTFSTQDYADMAAEPERANVRYWDLIAAKATGPELTMVRYWDLIAPLDEPNHPQTGQRKARSSSEADVDPDAAVKRGLAPR